MKKMVVGASFLAAGAGGILLWKKLKDHKEDAKNQKDKNETTKRRKKKGWKGSNPKSGPVKTNRQELPDEKLPGCGKSVLITGGSSGIGLEFAKVYAARGYAVILAARNPGKLAAAANEIFLQTQTRVQVVSCDLSTAQGNMSLYENIVNEMHIELDELVNCAGAGKTGKLIDTDLSILQNLIELNVSSMTILNRLFGADMAKRGHGMIMNVASMNSFVPAPNLNVYGAAKAYDLFLTEAMLGELEGTGVQVCALCPGPVKTGWSENAGRRDSVFSLSASQVAREGFEGMHAGKWLIIPGRSHRIFKYAMDLLPVPLKAKGIAAFQKRLEKQN